MRIYKIVFFLSGYHVNNVFGQNEKNMELMDAFKLFLIQCVDPANKEILCIHLELTSA